MAPSLSRRPLYGDRIFSQQLKRTNWPPGSNNRGSNEEVVTTELGQVGTQIDGFGHQSIGNSLYNCFQNALTRQDPMIVGSDSCCVEVNPNPEPNLSSPVHQILLVAHGIYTIESLKLDELLKKGIQEFAFIVQPLKLRGATGSSVAPAAVR